MSGTGRSDVGYTAAARVISAETDGKRGPSRRFLSYLRWLWGRRELVWAIAHSELLQSVVRRKLSYLWWIMDPLFDMLCFVFLMFALGRGGGFKVPYPLYILTALGPWRWSLGCWTGSTRLWTQYQQIITQVRFPYMALIFSRFLSELVLYLMFYVVVFGACLTYGYYPSVAWLFLPVVILMHSVMVISLMFYFSMLGLHFSDFEGILPFLLRLWFFCSPAIYSVERLPAWAQQIMRFNPMSLVFQSYRDCILYARIPNLSGMLAHIAIFAVVLLLGMAIFIRREPYIARYF